MMEDDLTMSSEISCPYEYFSTFPWVTSFQSFSSGHDSNRSIFLKGKACYNSPPSITEGAQLLAISRKGACSVVGRFHTPANHLACGQSPITYCLGSLCPLLEALASSNSPQLLLKYICVNQQLWFSHFYSPSRRLSPAPLPTNLWLTSLFPFQGTPWEGLTSAHQLFCPQNPKVLALLW